MSSVKGIINKFETFGSVDGPGVRFVAFMQGCKMRCKYCHNPETWSVKGNCYTPKEVFDKVWKLKNYYKNGGVTVSGGEPLLQLDFLIEFFKLLKEENIHTAIDTAGQPFSFEKEFITKFDELLNYTDLFLLDIKMIDRKKHKELTSQDNENILQMAKYLSEKNKKIWIRYVLVPDYTDAPDDIRHLKEFVDTLNNVEKIEVLPYHTYGINKWENLGIDYPLKNVSVPSKIQIETAEKILKI